MCSPSAGPDNLPSVTQFKGKASLLNMKTSQKGVNLIFLTMVLWGLVQVACGLSILVTVLGYWDRIFFPLNEPLFVFAVGPIFTNAGTWIIAFAFVRGKFLRIAVFVTSAMSMIFGVSLSFLLTVSRHANARGYDKVEDSTTETVYLFQLTIGMVIALGNSFTAVLFSLFLPRCCCCASTPGVVHFEEEADLPPPYHHQTLETMSFVKCQDLTSFGNLETYQAMAPPPVFTSTDWTRYQASNLALLTSYQDSTVDKCEKLPSPLPA